MSKIVVNDDLKNIEFGVDYPYAKRDIATKKQSMKSEIILNSKSTYFKFEITFAKEKRILTVENPLMRRIEKIIINKSAEVYMNSNDSLVSDSTIQTSVILPIMINDHYATGFKKDGCELIITFENPVPEEQLSKPIIYNE